MLSEEFRDQIIRQVRFALDWTMCVKRAWIRASNHLESLSPDHSEVFRGLFQQFSELERLEEDLRALTNQGMDGRLWEEELFFRICNINSLYPFNPEVLALLRYVWRVCGGDNYTRLVEETQGCVLYLHISCEARLEKAHKSVWSFGAPTGREAHVIIIGEADRKQPGIGFTYNDGILKLAVGDVYEAHYQKTLYSYSLVATLLDNPYVLKLDDDVSLGDRSSHSKALDYVKVHKIDYLGYEAIASPYSFYRGWHINKCSDNKFHRQGLSSMATTRFAMGGAGYLLSRKSVARVRDIFLSTPLLFSMPEIPLVEDLTVGMMLNDEDIRFCHFLPKQLGLCASDTDESLVALHRHELKAINELLGYPFSLGL